MSSRTTPPSTGVAKAPVVAPDVVTNLPKVKTITSTDTLEIWADNGIWDSTTGLPVSVDLLGITGTPRKRA